YDMWSRGSDRFIGVRFPIAGTFDILWDSLEITDEQFLAERAVYEQKRWEQLKEAKEVVRYVGPKGGFKYLSYQYPAGATYLLGTVRRLTSWWRFLNSMTFPYGRGGNKCVAGEESAKTKLGGSRAQTMAVFSLC